MNDSADRRSSRARADGPSLRWPLMAFGAVLMFLVLGFSAFCLLEVISSKAKIDTLEQQVANLQKDQNSVNSSFGSLPEAFAKVESRLSEVEDATSSINFQIGDLTDCVNNYMEVVGNSRGGYYRYNFC